MAEEVPLSGGAHGEANLRHLIAMTRDSDLSNRDWATMLLANEEVDGPDVRAALLEAASDEDVVVRAEAMLGLARRDKALALPFVREALAGESACRPLFEAAQLVGDSSLVAALTQWAEPAEDDFLGESVRDALAACENGSPVESELDQHHARQS